VLLASGSPTMHAFAFICLAAAAPHAWGLLDARAMRRGREAGKNRRLSDDFSERVKVAASDAAAIDWFGSSVAIDGDTVVIGAPYAGTGGAVYVLRASDGAELAKLTASDAALNDLFGSSVAIDGSTIVVGATSDDDGGSNSGSVYVFEKSTWGTYDQVAKLTASDAAANDLFGSSVAIDGATVVVGAYVNYPGGSTYVFRTTDGGATYVEVAKLTADDAGSIDQFGISVAIAGDTIVVGAYIHTHDSNSQAGSAYVFRTTDGATYSQVAKLTAADAAASDGFGVSVAIDGATIVVGAHADDDAGSKSGSAYVFRTTDDGTTYVEVAKLTAADAAEEDYFGTSVAIDGNTVVIGADQYWNDGTGVAYVFRTSDSGASYDQVAKLTASDAAADDRFGNSVAIDGATIVVGAIWDDDAGSSSGSAYVFEVESGWWDYFSSDAARALPSAAILLAAAAVLAAILA
jgi:hypothetical protein